VVKFTNNNNELVRLLKQLISQGKRNGSSTLFNQHNKEYEQSTPREPLIPNPLFKELLELQNETLLTIKEMVRLAVRRYIDSERSNDKHVWINGIKYPIPERNRIP